MSKKKTTSTSPTNNIPGYKIGLAGIVLLSLFSFTAVAEADSILLEMKPKVVYGNDIKITGMISFGEIKFHRGIPVSMELRDDTRNVIDAQSALPKEDGSFYYVVPGNKIKEFDGTKSFTVTVYYGSPNPSLLNTQYSTTDSFKVVTPEENNSIQKIMQKTGIDHSNIQPNAVSEASINLEMPKYSSDALMIIAVVVFLLVVFIVLKIAHSRLVWKKAEALAAKANRQTARNIQENYIR